MPYCPKCDMEFVKGIITCTDCGAPLVKSREAWDADREKRMAREAQEAFEAVSDRNEAVMEMEPEERLMGQRIPRPSFSYVTKSQKYEDLCSSCFAFFLVGTVTAACSAACFAGLIRLPFSSGARLMLQGVTAGLGLVFLLIALRTRPSLLLAQQQAREEERRTGELLAWFLNGWDAGCLDRAVSEENPGLTGPEMDLKRLELIQDILVTGQDLPDPGYVDYLSEQIFEKLYESMSLS